MSGVQHLQVTNKNNSGKHHDNVVVSFIYQIFLRHSILIIL